MTRKLDDTEIKVQVSEEPDCRRVINVEISPDRLRDEKERLLNRFVKSVSVPGFRKGKVPPDIVKRQFAGEIESEVIKSLLPLAYGHIVTSEKLAPVGEPVFSDINMVDDEPMTFSIEVEVFPEIEVSNYRGIDIEAEEIIVSDEDIEEVLGSIQARNADFVKVDRPAVKSDAVIIDYAPVGDSGEVEEKNRIFDYPVQLGSGQLLPAFENAVAGKAAGSTARVEIDYPENFKPEHLAGRRILYEFTVKDVREKRVPPLDDSFAQKLDQGFKNLDDLREDVRRRLFEEKEKESLRNREEQAIDLLIEKNDFDVPQSMVEKFKEELYEEDARRRQLVGAPPEEDEETKKRIDELFEEMALRRIKRYFLLDHIAGLEGIKVEDADIEGELEAVSKRSGKPIEEVKGVFSKGSEHLSNLKNHLRERKVFEVILGPS